MIEIVTAIEFVRSAKNGRTKPLIMVCEKADGTYVELFCKFSNGCDQGIVNLAREAFSAYLAADLGLPVPTPYFVKIPSGLAGTIKDQMVVTHISESVPLAFGSTLVKRFTAWMGGYQISQALLPTAAATLVFDGIIQNPDRRLDNPNCLVKGDEIRLIDHELAFMHKLIIGWKPPWEIGGLQSLSINGSRHIFVEGLTKVNQNINFEPIKKAWLGLVDESLQKYKDTIPVEWAAARSDMDEAARLIAEARCNIDGCLAEVRRILT